jgi:sulfatase maturation enzyme AslB (radical SAM superfamily)
MDLADTYCSRSWYYFLVDLSKLEQHVCCKTPWLPMVLGEDWFDGPAIRARREDHLRGARHSDCASCWHSEDRTKTSTRLTEWRPTHIPQTLDSYDQIMLEIQVGNTCDLACRYCSPRYSSIWANRLGDHSNSKIARDSQAQDPRSLALLAQFYSWLDNNKHRISKLILIGGETLLLQETYDILDNIDWHDVDIVFTTNLNTPDHYLSKIETAIDRLVDRGNRITFRCSIDGIGDQNDWQRQNGNWARWRDNWFRLGSRPVTMLAAFTVTPLTLEGMPSVGRFVRDSQSRLANVPIWESIDIVQWPKPLDPTEWFGSFADELSQLDSLLDSSWHVPKAQLATWLEMDHVPPSYHQTRSFVDFCDQSQARWGGGDWREIYPKTAAIAQRVLDQGPA